jgi:oligoendopeptidase F
MLPKWNLDDLYKSTTDLNLKSDLDQVTIDAKKFEESFLNHITSLTAKELLAALQEYERIAELLGKISAYAYLYFVTDMNDNKIAVFFQNTSEKINNISKYLLFFPLQINQIPEEKITLLYEKSQELAKYKPFIRDLRVAKKYQKSQEIEKILHEKDQTSSNAWSRLFDETVTGLEFSYDNKKLTSAEIFDLLSSHDSAIRKTAALAIGKTLGNNIKLFSFITNILAKDKAIDDEIRNYPHPVKSRNVSNLIEDEVVDSLINTVKRNYSQLSHHYYQIKAKLFGLKELDYWDRNAPLPNQAKDQISWQKAQDIVLNSYHRFCPEMSEIAKKFFVNNWIDAGPKNGKDSGAFAHPVTPSTHPYVMMNFQGKLRDVMTLAHELGHGIHQYLSAKQGYLMADTPLTLAETASIFGEQLTFESLLTQCENKEQKRDLLISKIEDSLNTIVRQVAFYDFEYHIHNKRKQGELTAQEIGEIWLNTQKDSLGPAIKFYPEYQYYWSYIPHFIHSPFYVYSYAFGNCLVNSLYNSYHNGLDNFVELYKSALTAGGTLHHSELLKPFDLDASKADFWQKGLDLPISYIKELETLI